MAKAGAAGADDPTQAPLLLPQPPPSYGVPVGGGYYQEPPVQPYLLIPVLSRRRRSRGCRPACCESLVSSSSLLALLSAAVILGSAAFFLWPSDPDVRLSRLGLRRIHISTDKHGGVSLDFDMDLKVRVRNPDFFSLDYDEIRVAIGYRGRRLGTVTADGGHVRARGISFVDARLRLDGIRVLQDAFYLIEDLSRGKIPFDTMTVVEGQLHLFGIDIPLEGRISCSVDVDAATQTIASQTCYPE
ncbi:hypothetical protein Taro_045380 [Colocasia esculenta]|uniref:Late embryogenesis abundant protein LEA-2 subgroup domain-containing protein n=1 Tax=Colocasia esculenta TaxID=4460 RepID=A0A843X6G8_COLES|nr:hypothetical protein [Colocasia esculenta]